VGKRRFERTATSGAESTVRAGAGASALHKVSQKITPQMILLSHERQCFSRTNNRFGTTPTACSRFAVLSRIEILHTLLEHFYDSQRNENAGSTRRLHRRQPVGSLLPGSRGGIVARSTRGTGRKPHPPCPVRLLVNRCSSRRSSGNTDGRCLWLPLHCEACQRSLTRWRSLPPLNARHLGTRAAFRAISDPSVLPGDLVRLRSRSRLQLFGDRREVVADRAGREERRACDLADGPVPLCDRQHLRFPRGQR
jgi:hypothetical protein